MTADRSTPPTILVVDDEEIIREIAQAILEGAGYRVLCAMDGPSGLRVLADPAECVDLVLLDENMPVLDGRAVLAEIRRDSSSLPVILSSGQGGSTPPLEPDGSPARFLRKPYRSATLLEAVRQALG